MENQSNKNTWIWIVVIVLVIVGIVIAVKMKKSDTSTVADNQNPSAVEVTEDVSDGSVDAPKTAGVAPVTMSYANALIKYKDARIQIGDQCTVSKLSNLTFKNNTDVMIDNRSSVAHTLKIGSTFSVKGYGFKIINLTTAKVPGTLLVDCDSSQNVTTILIQK